jgi:hypothetical protein
LNPFDFRAGLIIVSIPGFRKLQIRMFGAGQSSAIAGDLYNITGEEERTGENVQP